MSNPTTGFSVGADVNPFEAAMRRMVDAAKEGEGGVSTALTGLAGHAQGLKVAFGVLSSIASGAFLKEAITATTTMTEKAMDLSRALGVSTNEARLIQMALEDIGADAGEFEAAAKGMVKKLKENEETMNAMGLATRDAAGNLRPMNDLVTDGIQVLGTYKEGADRALASQELFGKGIDASSKLMLYNKEVVEENRAAMTELGLEVGENSVAAWKAFDAQADRAGFSMQGLKKAIGDALLPVITTLVEVFNSVMPAAITVVKGALAGLATAFLVVRNGVVVLGETINAMVITVAEPIRALIEAMYKVMTGDFAGAGAAIKNVGNVIAGAWENAMQRTTESSRKTVQEIKGMWLPDTVAGSGGGLGAGSKNMPEKPEKTEKEKAIKEEQVKESSRMQEYDLALEKRRLGFEMENQMREFSKTQELAYWRSILEQTDVTEKDRMTILLKSSKLEVQIAREAAKQQSEITTERNNNRMKAELDHIGQLEAIAQQEQALGLITNQELLAQQQQFNAQRMAAELEFLNQKLELAKLDPDKNLVLIEQLEIQKQEIYRKYAASNAQIARDIQAEINAPMKSMIDSISTSLANLSKTMLTDWRNVGQALRNVFKDIGLSIIEETITKPLKAKLAAWLTEKIFGKTKALGRLGELSAEAGAGGVASMAAAPFPLNLSAPAFGAAMSALAFSFAPLASAQGGFDIPAGLNPLTQLHEQEMVLPKEHAEVIRGLAGQGGGAGSVQVTIQALDGASVKRVLMDNPDALANAFKHAAKRGFA